MSVKTELYQCTRQDDNFTLLFCVFLPKYIQSRYSLGSPQQQAINVPTT